MKESVYYPNEKQVRGVDEYRLVGGKGDQMSVLHLRNGCGLEAMISPDRCLDISRLTYRGVNCSYLGAVGMVGSAYYQDYGTGFRKSFTAGFFTTCGLSNVGDECEVNGEHYAAHGTMGSTPAEHYYYQETDTDFKICGTVRQVIQGGERLRLTREMAFSKTENRIVVTDTVKNIGEHEAGVMLMYHINVAYPLLSEHAKVEISSDEIEAVNPYAKAHIAEWGQMAPPTDHGESYVYRHTCKKDGVAQIYNPDLGFGLRIVFDTDAMPCLNQWKMERKYDYVMGLEPGNCFPMGRPAAEAAGQIDYLKEGEEKTFTFTVELFDGEQPFKG